MALLEAGSTLIGTLVPSLGKLLVYELELSGQVKKGLHSLEEELKLMHTFLEKTSCVPLEKLEEQDKAKVVKVRKLTRAIEPRLHSYASRLEGTVRRCTPLWAVPVSNLYINHQMAGYIQERESSREGKLKRGKALEDIKNVHVFWSHAEGTIRLRGGWEGDSPFPELRQLLLFGVSLPRLAPWIHWSSVPNLSRVLLQVEVLEARDLETLGKMPRLRSLYLRRSEKEADHKNSGQLSYTASRDEFSVLEYLNTNIEFVVRRDDGSNNGLATSCIVEDDGFELTTLMKRVMGDGTSS